MADDHTLDLCQHLLAVLTGMLEDAAAVAAAGQGVGEIAEVRGAATALNELLARCSAIAQAAGVIGSP